MRRGEMLAVAILLGAVTAAAANAARSLNLSSRPADVFGNHDQTFPATRPRQPHYSTH